MKESKHSNLTDGQRYNSVDFFRYVCAIMVVAIHTHPFEDVHPVLGFIFTQIIPRIGVPFFFSIAGFFYIQKIDKGEAVFGKYVQRLLLTYLLWSCIYYAKEFILWGHNNIKGFVVNCVLTFFVHGSSYHFWFFPALFFSVFVTTLFWKCHFEKIIIPLSLGMYAIGCIGCAYYNWGVRIPILGTLYRSAHFNIVRRVLLMGFPFFVSGQMIYRIREKFTGGKTSNKSLIITWMLSITIWLGEIGMVYLLELPSNIVITFGLYPLVVSTILLLLNNPMSKLNDIASICRMLSNFTYYSHPLFSILISYLGEHLLHTKVTSTLMFATTVAITSISGYALIHTNKKYVRWLLN